MGGPRSFLLLLLALAGCSAGGAGDRAPAPREPFARPLEIYRDLGFMTGTGQFPAVASFGTLAGPADSTWVLLALSLPNNALRFQRDEAGFTAAYHVEVTVMSPDSVPVTRFRTTEHVRIPSFTETARSDESVIYQRALALAPGSYLVRLQASDANSARGFRMMDTLTVPAYGTAAATLAAPLLVYQSAARHSRGEEPAFLLNPRHTVPFGGEAPVLYVEAYDDASVVAVQVVSEDSAVVWQGSVPFEAVDGDVRSASLTLPADTLPLGRFSVRVRTDGAVLATPLVLTISDQWMVANFDDVLQFIRFIAHDEELDSLRSGSPTDRRRHWEEFWVRRDPLPIAGVNEYREQFFQRVRIASELFRESTRPGWQTHRGEVFIVLGPPDQSIERSIGRADISGRANALEWVYSGLAGGRLNLLFHDRSGFGRYELTPSSASAFRSAAERMKPRLPRD